MARVDVLGCFLLAKAMDLASFLSGSRKLALRLVVVLPVLALVLFPAGMMPGQATDGQMVWVLCSGDGPVMMTIDPATGAFKQVPPSGTKSACDWDMAHSGVTLPATLTTPLPLQSLVRAAPALASLDFRPAHDPRGIYARGPPSLM